MLDWTVGNLDQFGGFNPFLRIYKLTGPSTCAGWGLLQVLVFGHWPTRAEGQNQDVKIRLYRTAVAS